jgi:hypothetical protein
VTDGRYKKGKFACEEPCVGGEFMMIAPGQEQSVRARPFAPRRKGHEATPRHACVRTGGDRGHKCRSEFTSPPTAKPCIQAGLSLFPVVSSPEYVLLGVLRIWEGPRGGCPS